MFFGIFNYLKLSVRRHETFFLSLVLYIYFDIFSRKINLKIGVLRHEQSDGH